MTVNLPTRPVIVCPSLPNPDDGQVVQALDGNVPGTVANYSCNAGYTLLQSASRECVRTGLEVVWTGEAPTCQRKPVYCMWSAYITKSYSYALYVSTVSWFNLGIQIVASCTKSRLDRLRSLVQN